MIVELNLVETPEERELVRDIIRTHHSYVPTTESVGRRIDWLILIDGEVVGMIGIGSATYPPCKDVLRRLGVTKEEYRQMFNSIANNWRFCMSKPIPNAGTQILKALRKNAPTEWKNKYGDDLKYLITFVGGGNVGAVYRADNWEMIGETAGLPPHKAVSMKWDDKSGIDQKFVKPNGENKKLIFFKKL